MTEENESKIDKILFTTLRVLIGWIFFFAFLDKTFGLGFYYGKGFVGTKPEYAWLAGNSPTEYYLDVVLQNKWFSDFFATLGGNPIVDFLFMFGLLGIGIAMIFGIFRQIAAVSGVLMMLMMWAANLPLNTNPLIDDHIIYALIFLILGFTDNYGYVFIPQWEEISDKNPILA